MVEEALAYFGKLSEEDKIKLLTSFIDDFLEKYPEKGNIISFYRNESPSNEEVNLYHIVKSRVPKIKS